MIKLFVVGYHLDIQEVELIEMFSAQGLIHSINLITDKYTRKHKGYGFIEMVDQAGADRAIAALNGLVWKGRKITVKLADEDREQKPREFKGNHFSSPVDRTGDSMVGESKSRRPRKLVSQDFKVGKNFK